MVTKAQKIAAIKYFLHKQGKTINGYSKANAATINQFIEAHGIDITKELAEKEEAEKAAHEKWLAEQRAREEERLRNSEKARAEEEHKLIVEQASKDALVRKMANEKDKEWVNSHVKFQYMGLYK